MGVAALQVQRTSQSMAALLLPLVLLPGLVLIWNAGGGVNGIAGFFGMSAGGCLSEGVKPNWPAEKLLVPLGLVTWISPSNTCTYSPGARAALGGGGASCASAELETSAASKARQLEVNFFMRFPSMWGLSEKLLKRLMAA